MKKGYAALNLTSTAKSVLLKNFPSLFSKVVAHHCTLAFGVKENYPLPEVSTVKVIGYAANEKIECVVVEVEGSINRPDGSFYHITLSHSEKARPVESNDLLKQGFKKVPSFEIDVVPTFNSFK